MNYSNSYYDINNCSDICKCFPCCPKPDIESKEYGFFYDSRIYNTALYGGLFFTKPPIKTDNIYTDDIIITLFKTGTYFITYSLHFPVESTVSTTLSLQTNDGNYPGTTRIINKTSGYLYTETVQTILIANNIVSIRLSSSSILDFNSQANDTLISLTIIEI